MILDTHQHYWQVDRGDYHWMSPEVAPLVRDFLPPDLTPEREAVGVTRTVVVQAAATEAETHFLLSLAASHRSIAGVVGWTELDCADFPARLAALREDSALVSIRPMIQDIDDDRWILRPRVLDALRHLVDQDFPIDLLTLPRHLPHLVEALQQVPGLRGVINHLSKPLIKDHALDGWAESMAAVATFPNIYCKVSGMVTEADHDHWTCSDFKPYVAHVHHCFGPERLMFGSDWPVCTLAASYGQVVEAARSAMSSCADASDLPGFWHDNGATFYGLVPTGT